MGESTPICPHVFSTGQLGTTIHEQALVLETANGLAVITGCAHPGVVNMIRRAKQVANKDVYLLMGGFHMGGFSATQINKVIADFQQLSVQKAAPCHCSGDQTRRLFAEACQFSAIAAIRQAVITFPQLCAGCGACSYVCPTDAIAEVPREVGLLSRGKTAEGIQFIQGRLTVGDQRATPVTRAAKDCIAEDTITILDAPPGTACPMQETIEDSDYCILVTEPTPFGLANLQDSVETCRRMDIPCGVIINRDGVGNSGVEEYCSQENLPLLLRISQQRRIAEAYSRGETLVEALPEWTEPLQQVFEQINNLLN